MRCCSGYVASFCLASSLLSAQPAEVFKSPGAGFEITKPQGWIFFTAQQNVQNLSQIKVDDPAVKAAMLANGAPLVEFIKPSATTLMKPTVAVLFQPLGKLAGRPATQLMEVVLPIIGRGFKDVRVTYGPNAMDFKGFPAAYAQMVYTLRTQAGQSIPVLSELWIFPYRDSVYIINVEMVWQDDPALRSELTDIINSIKIGR